MPHLSHSGMGWSNGPISGGNERILALPSDDLLLLGSEHWHHDEAARAGKHLLFRGMARQGFRPAELGWDVRRYVDEILRDAVRVSEPITDFVGWNELNLQDERGDQRSDFGDLTALYTILGAFTQGVLVELRKRPVTKNARLHFGAWAPKDETDYIDHWRAAADLANVMDVHAYGNGAGIIGHIDKYRALFPGKPVELTEWHSDYDGPEADRDTLAMLANYSAVHQDFRAYYFLYRWFDPPTHQRALAEAIAVEGNPARLALFRNPPILQPEEPEEPDVPILDPWQYWTPEAIATAIKCPVASIQANWPRLVEQLEHCHLTDKATWIAMLATVSLESARRFEPIHEFKNADGSIPDYWYTYDGGPEFHGRGFIQNTHRYNYAALGPRIAELWGAGPADFDFVTRPDDLLDPDVSAACAALYFRDHGREDGVGIPEAAAEGNWREVRRLVQGGSAGLDILIAYATALGGAMQPPVDESNAYGPNVPDSVVLQQNNWSCAVRSTYAALWSMAQVGQGEAVTYGDDGPRDVYNWMVPAYDAPNIGLLDHTGAGIARMLRDHGYAAEHIYPATLAQAKDRAGRQPLLIGGDAWNHWAMVRGKTTDGGLIVENPSPGHMGITDYLRDSWDRIGPMALVWISPASVPVQPSYEQLANLEGVAYHDDGVVIPALAAARISNDWSQVDAVIEFLRANDPHRTG